MLVRKVVEIVIRGQSSLPYREKKDPLNRSAYEWKERF
jgi:hypothetical protein